jgi:hypothetical protein
MCGAQGTWLFLHGHITLTLSDLTPDGSTGGTTGTLPSAVVVCGRCGYTHLLNLLVAKVVTGASDPDD